MNRGGRVGNLTRVAVAVGWVEHRSPREERHRDGGLTEPGTIAVDCDGLRCGQAMSEGYVHGKPFTLDEHARGISLEDQTVVADRDDMRACTKAAAQPTEHPRSGLRADGIHKATESLGRGT